MAAWRAGLVAGLCAVIGLFAARVSALDLPDPATAFQVLGRQQGLSLSSGNAITQDSKGFIWIATDDGVSRFDGHQVQVFQRRNSWLAAPAVLSVCAAAEGSLWFGFYDGGVQWYDPKTGENRFFPPDVVGVSGPLPGDINKCIDARDQDAVFAGARGVFRVSRSGTVRVLWQHADPDDPARALGRDSQGTLWAVSAKRVLRVVEDAATEVPGLSRDKPFYTSAVWLADTLYLGTSAQGLWQWRVGDPAPVPAALGPTTLNVLSLFADRLGRLWVGTQGQGVWVWQPGRGQAVQLRRDSSRTDSLPDDTVQAFFQSREGVLWLGTWVGGVAFTDVGSSNFHVIRHRDADPMTLPGPSVRAILPEGERLWVAADTAGLAMRERADAPFRTFRHDPARADSLGSDHVRVVFRAANGELWIGSDHGLDRWLGGDRFSRVLHPGADPESLRVRAIAETPQGRLWLATWGRGVLLFDPTTGTSEVFRRNDDVAGSVCGDRVTSLAWRPDGQLLVGTDDGGACFLRPGQRRFERLEGAPLSVWAFYEDSTGLYMGSYGDYLAHLSVDGQRRAFGQAEGLSNDVVYQILPDRAGRLWLSSNDGLFAFDPARRKFTHFADYHGLQDREFNSGAGAVDAAGRLWFGGVRGLTWFDPANAQINRTPPETTLTELVIGDTPVQPSAQGPYPTAIASMSALDLPADVQHFSLAFSGMHYARPGANRFRYRVREVADFSGAAEDSAEVWHDVPGQQASTRFAFLPPGEYLLEVQAVSAAGVIDASPAHLSIRIAAPFWKSRSAYTGYFVALVLVGVALVWVRHRHLRRLQTYMQELQAQVSIRTRELEASNAQLVHLNAELLDTNSRLEKISLSDPLTGLGNRRLLARYLEKDLPLVARRHADARERQMPACEADLLFMLIDLDHFKRINDRYGHDLGDQALLDVRDRLLRQTRAQDVLIRYGGEEFLLLLRYTDRRHAAEHAERIRQAVCESPFSGRGVRIPLSASIGFCAWPPDPGAPDCYSADQALQIADCLLYLAKARGRDTWVGLLQSSDDQPNALIERLRDDAEQTLTEPGLQIAQCPGSVGIPTS